MAEEPCQKGEHPEEVDASGSPLGMESPQSVPRVPGRPRAEGG
jgi:hypothetical protein